MGTEPSMEQRKVTPGSGSSSSKVKVGVVSVVATAGPDVMIATGGVRSPISQV